MVLIKATREVIEPGLCREAIPARQDGPHPDQTRRNEVWKQLEGVAGPGHGFKPQLLVPLWNRASHPATAERRAEWVSLQGRVAGRLGRKWKSTLGKSHAEFCAPDDLQLKPLDVVRVKLQIMQSLEAAPEDARNRGFWNGTEKL